MIEWTLDELVRRASDALAAADVRAPNGRVTELPDQRVIRWYATRGLVDRPAGHRGRSALYGPRHLLQILAIKRLQADGFSLAAIQLRLAGATDDQLRRIVESSNDAPPSDRPATDQLRRIVEPSNDAPPSDRSAIAARKRFWADPPPDPTPANGVLHGVALPGGVLLLVPVPPDDDDLAAIRAASAPLLATLADRGLTTKGSPA